MIGVWLVLACSKPIEAPAEVAELTLWFFEEWDNQDQEVIEAAVTSLLDWTDQVDFEARWDERAYEIAALSADELDGKIDHGRDPAEAPGVGLIYLSPHGIEEHLALQFITDQTPMEPSSPDYYQRTITQGEDCFADRSCDVLRYENDITRENIAYQVNYLMEKELLWVAVDGLASQAICGRSWMPESAHDEGKISLWQGYSIDLWIPLGSGTIRYQVSWQETELPGLTWDQVSGVVAGGIDDLFEAQDEYIAEQLASR
jgi:hypothetical protein